MFILSNFDTFFLVICLFLLIYPFPIFVSFFCFELLSFLFFSIRDITLRKECRSRVINSSLNVLPTITKSSVTLSDAFTTDVFFVFAFQVWFTWLLTLFLSSLRCLFWLVFFYILCFYIKSYFLSFVRVLLFVFFLTSSLLIGRLLVSETCLPEFRYFKLSFFTIDFCCLPKRDSCFLHVLVVGLWWWYCKSIKIRILFLFWVVRLFWV